MKKIVLVIVGLILTALPSFATEQSLLIDEAETKVKSLLRDPGSAQFQNLKIVTNSKAVESVCGEVNARNAFGGYTGFSKFNVSQDMVNIVDNDKPETIKFYKLSGGAGPEAELEVRLEDEVAFNCNVIWSLLTNVIIENQSNTDAIEAAIVAVKNRAKDNGVEIIESQIQMMRVQFQQSLDQTLANKKQVAAIKKNPEYQKQIILPVMYANTLNILKEQTKLKQ